MRIDCLEIRNFRRLIATRIEMSENTTLLVGANNSGKTSAITAIRYFLLQQKPLSVHDIPLSLWKRINELGRLLVSSASPDANLHLQWPTILPSMDVWITLRENEIHRVAHLIPKLDWKPADGIGVRLQLEPKDSEDLLQSFSKAMKASGALIAGRVDNPVSDAGSMPALRQRKFSLWPEGLLDYLRKHMGEAMEIKTYLLDPAAKKAPLNGMAQPQSLPPDSMPLAAHPLAGLIRVDEIPAHRGFGDYMDGNDESDESAAGYSSRRQILTAQLRSYYAKHLDPAKAPGPADIRALEAIHEAQTAFDERLSDSFKAPLDELQNLGYPGVANPRLVVSTQLRPVEGLNHQSAVQYDISPGNAAADTCYRLPEQYNGLGYQNLISMVFRLITFRDAWMKVGKATQDDDAVPGGKIGPPPLHLVLLEEPEAHLHVQVQQVFTRKAYDVLRKHPALAAADSPFSTQLIVSTHSGHVAHEVAFAHMRYFRRHPARSPDEIPTSTVLNLSEVFGAKDETARFVSRYLRVTHADLLFADGVILVEGAAERILVPYFIRNHFSGLHSCYVTLLEVGGSHAHRLAPLIEHLGINTLIITDLDSVTPDGHHRRLPPERGAGLLTANNTLKKWHPQKTSVDGLLDLDPSQKEKLYDRDFSVRVAYQMPLEITLSPGASPATAIPRTFEDALVLENLELFRNQDGTDLLGKFKAAIATSGNITQLATALSDALSDGSKAGFALDVLCLKQLKSVRVPTYISEGLEWLQDKLLRRQQEQLVETHEAKVTTHGGE